MTSKPGIAFSIQSGQIGGGQRLAWWVAREVSARSIPIHVLSPSEGPSTEWFEELGATVHIIDNPRSYQLWRIPLLARLLADNGIGTVYTHTTPVEETMIGMAAKRAGCRLILHRHSKGSFSARPWLSAYQRWLWSRVLKAADEIICVSPQVCDEVASQTRRRASLVRNGVPIPEQVAPPPGTKTVGFIGRLDPNKRVEDFIAAAALVGADHPELRFVIAGAGLSRDPYEERYRTMVRDLDLEGSVTFLGQVEHAESLLDTFDIFVFPSALEGHPLVLLEAMARGTSLIATDIPGIRDSVADGEEGFVVPVGSPTDIADRIRILTQDPKRAQAMGNAARERAIRDFAVERFLNEAVPLVLGERNETTTSR